MNRLGEREREREERGMEPLMYGEDLGGFVILKGAERHMRRVEKGADGLKVAAGILRAQALTYLRGNHGPKDLEGQGGTQAFERGSFFLDSDTSTYTDMDSDSNSSPTHTPQLKPTTPNSPAFSYFMLPPKEEAAANAPPPLPPPLPLDHRGKGGGVQISFEVPWGGDFSLGGTLVVHGGRIFVHGGPTFD